MYSVINLQSTSRKSIWDITVILDACNQIFTIISVRTRKSGNRRKIINGWNNFTSREELYEMHYPTIVKDHIYKYFKLSIIDQSIFSGKFDDFRWSLGLSYAYNSEIDKLYFEGVHICFANAIILINNSLSTNKRLIKIISDYFIEEHAAFSNIMRSGQKMVYCVDFASLYPTIQMGMYYKCV